jgi:DNA replication protein DnaC
MTEWQARRLKGVERGLRLARFPYVKTLEQFDFSFQPAIDRKLIRELAGLAFVERAENLILLGPPGTGKTMLAVALGIKAIEAGHRVLFLTLETRLPGCAERRPRTGWSGNSRNGLRPRF